MAPVLQCPDCGTKHPLSSVPDAGTFPCKGCGRPLKVPNLVPPSARTSAPADAPVVPPMGAAAAPTVMSSAVSAPDAPLHTATRAMPVVEEAPRPARGDQAKPVGLWWRFLLWVVALPLSFVLVFGAAVALGFLTSQQRSDIVLSGSFERLWPIVRLLPFVAVLTAVFVQLGVAGLSRRQGRHAHPRQPRRQRPVDA